MKFKMQRLFGAQGSRRLQALCLTLGLGTMSSVCHAQAVVNGDFAKPLASNGEGNLAKQWASEFVEKTKISAHTL